MTDEKTHVLAAPECLVAATRPEFRRAALECVERAVQDAAARVYVDLTATREVDSSGLGVLVLLQRRAREHMIATQLLGAGSEVRSMLVLNRLDYLFEFGD